MDEVSIPEQKRELIVLVDQTVKLPKQLQEHSYKTILKFLRPGDEVKVISFSANAEGNYTEVGLIGQLDTKLSDDDRFDVPKKQLAKLDHCYQLQQQSLKKAIGKELINIFKGADSNLPHTELLYNLDRLSRTYYSETRSQERYLLIISDMMEHSALTTFYASGQIRDLNAEKELEKLRGASLSNSFDQTKVYVIGAAYKQKKDYSSGLKIQKLQSFWEAYFNYGAASLVGFGTPTLLTPIQ
ncbi:hypothetical protein [Curvivirga aplysinae]|uniref:hypothetical protein n=1 Tax=Curvivirga aplysinae TaxID=2529852 RepID=UPI0012BC041A|nr:hypothetical protein [Curvivirga aplysinae]MTI08778.1 hypothetical protein [Curvivirga aplysinae]